MFLCRPGGDRRCATCASSTNATYVIRRNSIVKWSTRADTSWSREFAADSGCVCEKQNSRKRIRLLGKLGDSEKVGTVGMPGPFQAHWKSVGRSGLRLHGNDRKISRSESYHSGW